MGVSSRPKGVFSLFENQQPLYPFHYIWVMASGSWAAGIDSADRRLDIQFVIVCAITFVAEGIGECPVVEVQDSLREKEEVWYVLVERSEIIHYKGEAERPRLLDIEGQK